MFQWTCPQDVDGGPIEQSEPLEQLLCLRYCVAKVTVARMTVATKHSEVLHDKKNMDLGIDWIVILSEGCISKLGANDTERGR